MPNSPVPAGANGSPDFNRRSLLIGAAATVAAMPFLSYPTLLNDEVKEILRKRAALKPMQRLFFDQQLYAHCHGEPNVIDGTADYTYQDWLDAYPQWVKEKFETQEWVS